ncbi:hypothetical protein ACZ87_01465, partial [Candidatus Erwinia dacicola]
MDLLCTDWQRVDYVVFIYQRPSELTAQAIITATL